MYFDEDKINNLLNCKHCQSRLDEPRVLPCGEFCCSICFFTYIKVINNEFECLVCKNKHEMPKSGLSISKPLLDMLSLKPNKISRGSAFDSLQVYLIDLKNIKDQLELMIVSSNDHVKEHCLDLRADVQLVTEKAIEKINDFNAEIIQEIDDFENGYIQYNNRNKPTLKLFNQRVEELDIFCNENSKYLKNFEINDDEAMKLNLAAAGLKKKAELDLVILKGEIFGGNVLKFYRNNDLNKSILGATKVNNSGSLILPDYRNFIELLSLCELKVDHNWDLIYRGTRDGFEAESFHSKCDDKSNTLVIIKSINGNVFGGYTEQSWSGENFYREDPNAFIFSFKENQKLKMKCQIPKEAIFCRDDYGPIFGHDNITIEGQSNQNEKSWSDLGDTYKHPNYAYKSNEAQSFLAGSYKFKVSEIEVYSNIIGDL